MEFEKSKCPKCGEDVFFQPHMVGALVACQNCGTVFKAGSTNGKAGKGNDGRGKRAGAPSSTAPGGGSGLTRIVAWAALALAILATGLSTATLLKPVVSGGSSNDAKEEEIEHGVLVISMNWRVGGSVGFRSRSCDIEESLLHGGNISIGLCDILGNEKVVGTAEEERRVVKMAMKHGWKFKELNEATFTFTR